MSGLNCYRLSGCYPSMCLIADNYKKVAFFLAWRGGSKESSVLFRKNPQQFKHIDIGRATVFLSMSHL